MKIKHSGPTTSGTFNRPFVLAEGSQLAYVNTVVLIFVRDYGRTRQTNSNADSNARRSMAEVNKSNPVSQASKAQKLIYESGWSELPISHDQFDGASTIKHRQFPQLSTFAFRRVPTNTAQNPFVDACRARA